MKYYIATNPSAKLQLVGDLFEKQDYGFAFPEQSALRKIVNGCLLKLAEEGYFEELDRKWFGETPKHD